MNVSTWESFARDRGFRFTPPASYPNDELAIDGNVDGIEVSLSTRRHHKSVETVVRATSRHAMLGRVEVRPRRWGDRIVAAVRGAKSTRDPTLDEALVVYTSSDALLHVVLDERTLSTLRELYQRPLITFVYEDGMIVIRWVGVEESPELLDMAMGLAAHLAVTGSEVSPYR